MVSKRKTRWYQRGTRGSIQPALCIEFRGCPHFMLAIDSICLTVPFPQWSFESHHQKLATLQPQMQLRYAWLPCRYFKWLDGKGILALGWSQKITADIYNFVFLLHPSQLFNRKVFSKCRLPQMERQLLFWKTFFWKGVQSKCDCRTEQSETSRQRLVEFYCRVKILSGITSSVNIKWKSCLGATSKVWKLQVKILLWNNFKCENIVQEKTIKIVQDTYFIFKTFHI